MNKVAIDVIVAQGVGKRFAALTAIEHLSFACTRGEIFGFVGPDGAGKTTIMRLLAGIMPPDAGSIVIDGFDVVADPESAKMHLSYMPQRFGLYEDLTVDENIAFFADLFEIDRRRRDERATRLLAASGMLPFRKWRAGQLSGGMKQKLGLTCSLIHTPKILLLDEPTAGVDPVSRRDFWRILYDLRGEGVTIVIATSYLDEAERCTRLGLLYGGRMLHCGTPNELKELMPGELLVVASPQARQVRDLVRTLPGISKALLVGDSIHIIVDQADRRKPEIAEALQTAKLGFEQIERLRPSIEDLFMSLLDQPTGSGAA
jgi:ABC-2 type transport system ATP-binding protein